MLTCSILSGHTTFNKNILLMNYLENIPFKELDDNNKKVVKNNNEHHEKDNKLKYEKNKNTKYYFIKQIIINRKLKLFH